LVEDITPNLEGVDLAMLKVKGEINIQVFSPICLPNIEG
jgi:hypothetical protein